MCMYVDARHFLNFKANDGQLQKLLPKDKDGNIDSSKLPTGFSSSVYVRPEVTLGNELLQTGEYYR